MIIFVNYQHTDWGYNTISADGECLIEWAMKNNLVLLHNPKVAPSFYSGRWNTGTNPDLAFVSISDRCFHDRRVLERFVKNGKYKTKDRESDRLVSKEVSDLWRIPTPEYKCTSGEFTSDEFALALQ